MSRSALRVGTPLTFKEFEVAQLIAEALPIKVIMSELNISKPAVQKRTAQVMKKTGARTVPQLVCWMNCELFLAGLMVQPK